MPNQQMVTKQANRRRILDHLYNTLEVGVEKGDVSSSRLSDELGLTRPVTDACIRDISDIGILNRRVEFRPNLNGVTGGRIAYWTLTVDHETARDLLRELDSQEDDHYHRSMREAASSRAKNRETTAKIDAVVVRVADNEFVDAIARPEQISAFESLRELRKDEAFALVEAARQYIARDTTIDASVESLIAQAKSLGVTIDVDALRSSITVEYNERLEGVALALPYIERLERQVDRLTTANNEYRAKIKAHEDLARENRALKEQNTRLIAQRVVTAQSN